MYSNKHRGAVFNCLECHSLLPLTQSLSLDLTQVEIDLKNKLFKENNEINFSLLSFTFNQPTFQLYLKTFFLIFRSSRKETSLVPEHSKEFCKSCFRNKCSVETKNNLFVILFPFES
jgi:hypothetical protein